MGVPFFCGGREGGRMWASVPTVSIRASVRILGSPSVKIKDFATSLAEGGALPTKLSLSKRLPLTRELHEVVRERGSLVQRELSALAD